MTVDVPQPEMSDAEKVNFATETAFAELIRQAANQGLNLLPIPNLMYLPSQEVTQQFQDACRAVLELLHAD